MTKKIVFVVGAFALIATSCTKIQPPHVAIQCKAKFDACMVRHTFDGPLKAHRICMRERSRRCR